MRTSFLLIFLIFLISCNKPDTNPVVPAPPAWTIISSQPNTLLFSIHFTDSKKGFAVGSIIGYDGSSLIHGTILKTVTGGSSWANISNDTLPNLNSVFFTDSLTGYAVGTNCILKTTDAGERWSTIFNEPDNFLQSIFFADKNTGYATGISGVILKTTNAGQNWKELTSGTRCTLQSVYFTDNQTGYTVGCRNETAHSYGIILKTKNGGETWDSIPFTGETMPVSVVFTTADIGYAVGSNSILKTTDAGLNWTNIYSSPYRSLNAISFIRNSPSGFVVGQDGTILKTTDAGLTWTDVSFDSKISLTWVYFVNHSIGYAAGFDQQSKISTILKWQ